MNIPTLIVLLLVVAALVLALILGRRTDDPCRGCHGCDHLQSVKRKPVRKSNEKGCSR